MSPPPKPYANFGQRSPEWLTDRRVYVFAVVGTNSLFATALCSRRPSDKTKVAAGTVVPAVSPDPVLDNRVTEASRIRK